MVQIPASPSQDPPDHELRRRQHIQDHAAATSFTYHWGYATRVVPCVNDAGSCEYLDEVYAAHDQGMVFVAIMWAVILALVFGYGLAKRLSPSRRDLDMRNGEHPALRQSALQRFTASAHAFARRHTLIETPMRKLFGRTIRLQILILALLSIYLTIFTFVGFSYQIWVTPIEDSDHHNTRSSLGPWSDRIGVMAYALIPLSVLLANRESLITLITGIPYQNLNFLHRWLGYIIYIQSTMHSIGWAVIEGHLYQPQPEVWNNWVAQPYAIWGVVAMVLLSVMFFLSLPWGIRLTGYEVFRKIHYVFAAVFMGACYAHWDGLGCFLIASLVLWFLDRIGRLVRSFLIHYQYLPHNTTAMGFQPTPAQVQYFPDETNGDTVRLDFVQNHAPWHVGQHFYLTFPESSIWQSHPLTPISLPGPSTDMQQHSYIFRAKGGETKKIAEIASAKLASFAASDPSESESDTNASSALLALPSTPVILTGPYGVSHVSQLDRSHSTNVLCIAGGTGITFALPVLLHLMNAPSLVGSQLQRKIALVWMVRRKRDMAWAKRELDALRAAEKRLNLSISIFVTREDVSSRTLEGGHDYTLAGEKGANTDFPTLGNPHTASEKGANPSSEHQLETPSSTSPSPARRFSVGHPHTQSGHPNIWNVVGDFASSTVSGPTTVFASGPGSMITDLRRAVAKLNDAGRVWRGDERGSVELVCDDRLEW
ncbi:hypothetical protein MBLNU230_g4827t1 [Neophaeotheca triangularis]